MRSLDVILKENLDVYSNDETGITNAIEILKYNDNIYYLVLGFRNGNLLIMEIENEKGLK